MICSDVRTSLSAALDGEMPSLPPDVLDHHLEGCADCRAWSREVADLHRSLRVLPAGPEPDRTEEILAALPTRRRSKRPATDERVRGLRIATLVIALVQLAASLPLLIGDSMDGHSMDGHLERHIGISAFAMAVGLLVVAWRPERARAMLPILGVLVIGLVWSCFGDIWAGRPVPGNVLAHGADVAGFAAVWLLARSGTDDERARRHRAVVG